MRKFSYPSLWLVPLFCLAATINLYAQQKNEASLQVIKDRILADKHVEDVTLSFERSTPSAIVFTKERPAIGLTEVMPALRNYLRLRPGYDDFTFEKTTDIREHISIPQYQQYFKGIKVEYSRYKALAKNNDVLLLAGSFYHIPATLSVTPGIAENEALRLATSAVGAKKYAWQEVQELISKTTDIQLQQALLKELQTYQPKGELVIVKDFTNKAVADMRLAYKFNIYATEPLSRGYVFIDANTGKVLLYDAIIKHASEPTQVRTRYAGDRTIFTKQVSGQDPNSGNTLTSSHPSTENYTPGAPTYVLIDDTRGNGLETYDLNGAGGLPLSLGAIYTQGKSFTDVNNIWTLPEHKRSQTEGGAAEAENDDIAWDAHWGTEVVYDYWKKIHNRNSYDGNNAKIKSFIHYGSAYDNAFWNGSSMTYGDGSGDSLGGGFKPLTSLDVCGHEIGHGVCEFTSNLVYESESGAMNEAFSDIWAAAVENFVIKEIDPSLAAIYKPFFIGEQISYGAPLRRMDNPKLRNDPDTYGGQYWSNPDCVPNLANDYCGVHTNSGVLNKWFYLLTCGSGNGSGPDKNYVIPGVDDGMKDNGTTAPHNDGGTYSVTGLGFEISEQITFITETLLTSTATFAEARQMSINAAIALSGDPCGPVVQSVMNAWFAVGVGSAFSSPCVTTYGFVFQPGISISEGRSGLGCTGKDTVALPVLLPPNATGIISLSGTATRGRDYTITKETLQNTTSANKVDTTLIIINNDGVVESNETIVVSVQVANTPSLNATYTITLVDDDVLPKIGADSTLLLLETFETTNTGFNVPAGWEEKLEIPESGNTALDNGKNHWGVFNINGSRQLAITGRTTSFGITTTLVPGNYYNSSTSQTVAKAPIIDGRGLDSLRIKFNYTVQGEIDPNGTNPEDFGKFDYLSIAYSYDGNNFIDLGEGFTFASAGVTTGTFNMVLPQFLNNNQFYLGFKWYNDANAGGPISTYVDSVQVYGKPKKIETALARQAQETVTGAEPTYFYSNPQRNIVAQITGTEGVDFGCVTATIESAGDSTLTLYTTQNENNNVGQKIIRFTPSIANPSGAYNITLYFTENEIVAMENATATPRTQMMMYKTTAANFSGATASNTIKQPAIYTILNGGGAFTASFSSGFSAFAVGAATGTSLPVSCADFVAEVLESKVNLQWSVANEVNNSKFTIERSFDGTNFTAIGTVMAGNNNSGKYRYTDVDVLGSNQYFYRLKQTDVNGTSSYVCKQQLVKLFSPALSIGVAFPNPAKSIINVGITAGQSQKIQVEVLNSIGQRIKNYMQAISKGNSTLTVNLGNITGGTYMLRFTDEYGKVINTQSILVR